MGFHVSFVPLAFLPTVLLAAIAACSAGSTDSAEAPGKPEVGLIDVGARSYEIDQAEHAAVSARIFYSYHPATVAPSSAPLFVITGGGPGAAVLFLMGSTGPSAFVSASGAVSVGPNPHGLTDVAHLLYVDARNAGLSYAKLRDPSDSIGRQAEFNAWSYNVYEDAEDVLNVLFEFLDAHPSLSGHKVFFVAESYGGTRVSAMLSFLLEYEEYAAGRQAFHSRALSDRISRYLEIELGGHPSPTDVAERFAGQILIEPVLAGDAQKRAAGELFERPGSVVDDLARVAAVPYVRCAALPAPCDPFDNAQTFLASIDRSRYDIRADVGWLKRYLTMGTQVGTEPVALATLADVAEKDLGAVLSRDRGEAYRFGKPATGLSAMRGGLDAAWGTLEPWDSYFVALNQEMLNAFYAQAARDGAIEPYASRYGELFLRNARLVPTMVTRAEHDLQIYGPAIPPALESYPDVIRVTEVIASEELVIEYRDGIRRAIFSPWYHQSSHAVDSDEPEKLHADIVRFLESSTSAR
jgi:Serine carboxypeptidase